MHINKPKIIIITTVIIIGLILTVITAGLFKQKTDKSKADSKVTTIVFAHYEIQDSASFGNKTDAIKELIKKFEKIHPNIRVKEEILPNQSDIQHQYYVINLEGKTPNIDVLSMDVIWIKEFAKAGWILDLDKYIDRKDFQDFITPLFIGSISYNNKIYASPWLLTSGALFYRKDLLKKYGFKAPQTFEELVKQSQYILKKENNPDLYGYLWQGNEQEGMVCNVLEYLYSLNGAILNGDKVIIDSPQNKKALVFLQSLFESGVSPDTVKTSNLIVNRRLFLQGHGIFMRDWSTSYKQITGKDSPLYGKAGMANMPRFEGYQNAPVLGGHQLGINKSSKHPKESYEFIKFITNPAAQKFLAMNSLFLPSRHSVYKDEKLVKAYPFLKTYYEEIIPTIKSRPLDPYYVMFSSVLQSEFSAIIVGRQSIDKSLKIAKDQIEFIIDSSKEKKQPHINKEQ